jgi:hypothetical protein
MEERGRRIATRVLAGLGIAYGAALLARPRQIVDRFCPELPPDRIWLARLLGVRLLVQHGALLIRPRAALVRLGSAADLLHAASMVPFTASPRYGRAARWSGALAAGYAAGVVATAPRSRRPIGRSRAAQCRAWTFPSPVRSSSA